MPKEIIYGSEAREILKKGVDKVANAVKVTLGPKGRNVIISTPWMPSAVTKDGVTVARNIFLKDHLEEVGASAMREVAMKTLADSGDGTTTATVLAQAIYNAGMQIISDKDINVTEVKKGIDIAVDVVVESIKEMSQPVDETRLKQIATISANGDEVIGGLVAEAYTKVGLSGVVNIEDSNSLETRIELVNGMKLNKGYITPFAVNDGSKMSAEYSNVYVFICDKSITTSKELFNIFKVMDLNPGNPLLIICKDMDNEALAAYNANRTKSNIPVCVIQCPEWGDSQKELLKDIATFTGGKVVGDMFGTDVMKIVLTDFGRCAKISVTNEETVLVGGLGGEDLISARAEELRNFAKDAKDLDKRALEMRAANLTGSVAVIYVGGSSQIEAKERKDRCDDSVRATKAAIEEGFVPGGGTALFYSRRSVIDYLKSSSDSSSTKRGIKIIEDSISCPMRQIFLNSGFDDKSVNEIVDFLIIEEDINGPKDRGWNVETNDPVCMVESGIIDPAKVVRVALQNAASIAGTMLTSEVLMVEEPVKQ